MAIVKYKIGIPFAVIMLALGGFWLLRPHGYSWNHPALLHDCRMLASLCPSGRADWAPPGGESPKVYAACACAAGVHAVVGG